LSLAAALVAPLPALAAAEVGVVVFLALGMRSSWGAVSARR
jgi:hypothetical protein